MPAGEGDGGRQLLVDLAQLVPPRHQLIGLGRLMPESLAEVFVVEVRVLVLYRDRILGEGGWSAAVLRHLLLVDLDVPGRGQQPVTVAEALRAPLHGGGLRHLLTVSDVIHH